MKKYINISALVLTGALLAACGNKQQTEVTTSNNLFSTLHQLSEQLQGAVLRFVKTGNPSSDEETWPEYCGDKEMTVIA